MGGWSEGCKNNEMLTIYYIGFELDKGYIEVGTAGNMLGTCMKSGKIVAQKAGNIAKDQGGDSYKWHEV